MAGSAGMNQSTVDKNEESVILFFTGVINVVGFSIALCLMWHWFVVSKFHGAPEFGVFEMLGFSTLARIMIIKTSHVKVEDPRTLASKVAWDILSAPVILSIAWLTHLLAARFPWQLH